MEHKCAECGDDGTLYMHSSCHPEAQLESALTGEVLTLECGECGAVVVRFRAEMIVE